MWLGFVVAILIVHFLLALFGGLRWMIAGLIAGATVPWLLYSGIAIWALNGQAGGGPDAGFAVWAGIAMVAIPGTVIWLLLGLIASLMGLAGRNRPQRSTR